MSSERIRRLATRVFIPVALAAVIGAAAVVWLNRTSEPANALAGQTYHEALQELLELPIPGVDDSAVCVEEEVRTPDGRSAAHGLPRNATVPREVQALVDAHGVSFEDHEQRDIGEQRILLVSRDRINRHRFDGAEIFAHIIELQWIEGGTAGIGRFEIVHSAALVSC